ncbi:MAG TPA: DUF2892 domain-containing protein [Porticoccus sp.]|nr:DUF2892 domain-containing protein [Porticoccus sp.]
MNKRRVHDGIVGLVIILGVILGHYVDPMWLFLPGILGAILAQSAITGFCPLYYTLDKLDSSATKE